MILENPEFTEVNIEFPTHKILYETSDGRKFDSKEEAEIHDKPLRREAHYQFLLSKRNWLERFFNIQPDMSVWDMYNF